MMSVEMARAVVGRTTIELRALVYKEIITLINCHCESSKT